MARQNVAVNWEIAAGYRAEPDFVIALAVTVESAGMLAQDALELCNRPSGRGERDPCFMLEARHH